MDAAGDTSHALSAKKYSAREAMAVACWGMLTRTGMAHATAGVVGCKTCEMHDRAVTLSELVCSVFFCKK